MFNYYLGQFATSFLRKQATKKKSWLSADCIATVPEQNSKGKEKTLLRCWGFFRIQFQIPMANIRDVRTSQKIPQNHL